MSFINESAEQAGRAMRDARTLVGSSEVFDKYLKSYRLQAFQRVEALTQRHAPQRDIDIAIGNALAASDMYDHLFGVIE
jgi:hypothetical protein